MISRPFPVEATLQSRSHPLALLLRRLSLHGQLDAADEEAVLGLPTHVRNLEPGQYVVREREKATHSCLVVSGFAMRHKIGVDGACATAVCAIASNRVASRDRPWARRCGSRRLSRDPSRVSGL